MHLYLFLQQYKIPVAFKLGFAVRSYRSQSSIFITGIYSGHSLIIMLPQLSNFLPCFIQSLQCAKANTNELVAQFSKQRHPNAHYGPSIKFNEGLQGYRHPKICLSLGWLKFACHRKNRKEKFVCFKRHQTCRSVGVDFKLYGVVCLRVFKCIQ